MDQEERIQRIEEGQTAVIAHGFLQGPVSEYREIVLARMISNYRSGNTQHDLILGGLAELACLDNLMRHIQSLINKGNVAAEQEFK